MTNKKLRNKKAREFRKAGASFVGARKLAKLAVRDGSLLVHTVEALGPDFVANMATQCDCCGPVFLDVTVPSGKTLRFHMFTNLLV